MRVVLLTGSDERHDRFAAAVPHSERFTGDVNAQTDVILAMHPDVIFVYGTGKLGSKLVRACPYVLNLHGGDPERYRGLDSNLWALNNRDYDALQVTLHHVDDDLDTGDIVFQTQLDLTYVDSLEDLQTETADECVLLARLALLGIEDGYLPRRKQRTIGRYYSRMPDDLRERRERNLRQLAA